MTNDISDVQDPYDRATALFPTGRHFDTFDVMRRSTFALVVLALLVAVAAPASAGGSWFEPIETDIQPGDSVTMVGFSGFGPTQDPSVAADDPFYGWLEVDRNQRSNSEATGWPHPHDGMIPVGQITVTPTGQTGFQAYRLHLTFELPDDLPVGIYEFVHCNDPCTTSFGELLSGFVAVGEQTVETVTDFFGEGDPSEWLPATADLDNPLVAELVELNELALTGGGIGLVWYSAAAILGGLLLTTLGRRA